MRSSLRLGAVGVLLGTLLPMLLVTAPAQAARPKAKVKTVVALGFDDGDATHFTAAKILNSHGVRGTFYINSGDLNTRGKLSVGQVRTLARQGHKIGGHTLHHVRLTDLTAIDQRVDICGDRAALLKLKIPVTTFAYPFGANNGDSQNAARFCGYNAARTVGGLALGSAPVESMRPALLYSVRTYGSVNHDTTLNDLKKQVTAAERAGGGLLPVVVHKVCVRVCGDYSTTEKLLDEFLTWLDSRKKHGTAVRPLEDVIGGRTRPVPDESAWQEF